MCQYFICSNFTAYCARVKAKLKNMNSDLIIFLCQLNDHTPVPACFSMPFSKVSMLHLVRASLFCHSMKWYSTVKKVSVLQKSCPGWPVLNHLSNQLGKTCLSLLLLFSNWTENYFKFPSFLQLSSSNNLHLKLLQLLKTVPVQCQT